MFRLSRVLCACALVCAAGCVPSGEVSDDDNGVVDEGSPPILVVSRDGDLIAANASITITQGTRVALDASGSSDPDGDDLSFAWALAAPDGAAITQSDTPTFDYTFDELGEFVVTLDVSDGGRAATAQVTITVEPAPDNQAPTADAGADQAVVLGATVTLDGSGSSDPDGDTLAYAWVLDDAPAGSNAALSDVAAAAPTFTPALVGEYRFTLTVEDGNGGSGSDEVVLTVSEVPNIAPIADAGADQSATLGSTLTLDGSGSSDPDGDTLTFAWVLDDAPAGSTVALSDAAVASPTFAADVAGGYTFTLTVDDGRGGAASDTVVLTISEEPNVAPVANAGADQTVPSTGLASLDASGSSDADGDPLTFAWSVVTAPAGSTAASFGDATASSTTFDPDTSGDFTLRVAASDGRGGASSDDVVITVNFPPVANAGPDREVPEGSIVNLTAAASTDADGDPLTFTWSISSAPNGSSAALTGATSVDPSFSPDVLGDYVVQLSVDDGFESSTDTVVVTHNGAPSADAGADVAVEAGDLVTLDGTGSSDPEADAITYAWTLSTRPAGSAAALSSGSDAQPTFTADITGTYVAQLIVTDAFGNDSASDSITVTATDADLPPTADAGVDRSAPPGSSVTLDGSNSTDPENAALTYAWSFITRPAGSSASFDDPSLAAPSFTADETGLYVAQLVVTDAQGHTDADTVEIFANSANCPGGIIISEYVEGTGSNRALEIHNCTTAATFDLANYGLCLFANGVSTCQHIDIAALKPTLAPGETFAMCNTAAEIGLLSMCDGLTNRLTHTGNDTYALFVDVDGDDDYTAADDIVDVFGQFGRSSNFAMNETYDRCDFRPYDGSNVFDPTMAYAPVGEDVFSGVGLPPSETCFVANRTPVAQAGPNQVVLVGGTVSLDGRSSFDPDNDPLDYLWTITTRPAGSAASFSNATLAQPLFIADVVGDYVIELAVTDTANNTSLVDAVDISARSMLFTPNCTSGIFFSEYVEGSSSNKALEIYNCNPTPVNLDDYKICVTVNESTVNCESMISFTPGLVLPPNGYHVMCNNTLALAACDQTTGSISFTGNDRLGIYEVGTGNILDAIGLLTDPMPPNFAKDVTLERCDYTGSDGTTPLNLTQWASMPKDTFDNLGLASLNCP